jgi:hypothetical protein
MRRTQRVDTSAALEIIDSLAAMISERATSSTITLLSTNVEPTALLEFGLCFCVDSERGNLGRPRFCEVALILNELIGRGETCIKVGAHIERLFLQRECFGGGLYNSLELAGAR